MIMIQGRLKVTGFGLQVADFRLQGISVSLGAYRFIIWSLSFVVYGCIRLQISNLIFEFYLFFVICCLVIERSRGSALALLVPGVRADDVHFSLAPYDFAVLANPLDARSDFHGSRTGSAKVKRLSIAVWAASVQGLAAARVIANCEVA